MAGDLFGGVFDSLRGFSDNIGEFFSRGSDLSSRTVGFKEEDNLLKSGWSDSGRDNSSGIGSLFASAATDLASPKFATAKVDLDAGLTKRNNNDVIAGKSKVINSVDPSSFEQEWLSRLSKFSRIEEYAKKGETRVK